MSMWTHVVGAIHIDTYLSLDREVLQKTLENIIRDAPAISGSEGNCQIEVAIAEGSDLFVSSDCRRCQYEDLVNGDCNPPEDFICPEGEYQTRAIITLCGDLRDRRIDFTAEEVNSFVDYIDEKFTIRNMSIKIEDETEEIIRW